MKKIIFTLLAFCALSASAQNEQGQTVISVDVGYSIWGNLIKTVIDGATTGADDITTGITPVFIGAIDHGLTDNFSIGVSGAYQTISADFDYTWSNNGNTQTDQVESNINRINIAVRPNFHYGGNDNLDMYSGIRVGLNMLSTEFSGTADPDFEALNDFDASRLSIGLTAFGFRYYFAEGFGANMELSIGTPYAVAAGVSYKF